MRRVLAIVIGSNDMTVATFDSHASSVEAIDRTVVGADVHIGDDARLSSPGHRVGDPVPIFLPDGRSATGARLVATSIAELASRAAHDVIVVVHPATWSRYAVATLDAELSKAGVRAILLDRPSVADMWLRSVGTASEEGQAVVVEVGYDDTVVSCSRREAGRTGVVTEPGSDAFGAVLVDRALLGHVVAQVQTTDTSFDPADPSNWNDLHDVARRVSVARRRLDSVPTVDLDVSLGGVRRTLRLVRSELEELIVGDVVRMASRVAGTVAQFRTPVDAVVVHGAAASIPMVAEALSARTRTTVILADTPESVVVKGAVLWAVSLVGSVEPTVRIAVPIPAKRSSIWTRGRLWAASGVAALLLVGGFAATQTFDSTPASGPAPLPSAQMVGSIQPGR